MRYVDTTGDVQERIAVAVEKTARNTDTLVLIAQIWIALAVLAGIFVVIYAVNA